LLTCTAPISPSPVKPWAVGDQLTALMRLDVSVSYADVTVVAAATDPAASPLMAALVALACDDHVRLCTPALPAAALVIA